MTPINKKRKKITLSIEQKVQIIQKIDDGVRANRLAFDYGVSNSAITYIKSQKDEILAAVSNTFHEAKKKTLHKPEFPEMEEQLYGWILKQREKKCAISGPILMAKAMQIFSVSECNEPTEPKPSISYSTAIDSVNSLIKWCEENHQFSNRHISNLLALRTDMVVVNAKTQQKKQTKLTEFFEK